MSVSPGTRCWGTLACWGAQLSKREAPFSGDALCSEGVPSALGEDRASSDSVIVLDICTERVCRMWH